MRIFLINRYFFPDESATSQLASDLAFFLAGEGSTVHVLTSGQLYGDAAARLARDATVRKVRIERVFSSRFGRHFLLGRLIDYATFYASVTAMLFVRLRRGDIVISMTDPPLLAVLCGVVAKMRRASLVNWVQDVFPEVASRLGVIRNSGMVRMLQRIRDRNLRVATRNVVIGERMSTMIGTIAGTAPVIVPNWALEEGFEDASVLRREWDLDDRFVVGYSGNLGRAHHLSVLIEAAALICDPRVSFVFVGGGAQLPALRARVAELGLTNVLFKPYQPREGLRRSLCLPDIHVVSLDPALEGLIVPSKFAGVIAVGRPVLCLGDSEGELGSIIQTSGCGIVMDAGDARAIADTVVALSRDPARVKQMAAAATSLWQRDFQRVAALRRWSALLQETQAQGECA